MADYLEKRGNYWSAFLIIPNDLRGYYGSSKKRKALGTTDRRIAAIRAMKVVAEWKAEFEHLRALRNERLTPQAIEKDLKGFHDNLPEEEPFFYDNGSVDWIPIDKAAETAAYAAEQYDPTTLETDDRIVISEAVKVATGKIVRMIDYLEGWRQQADLNTKSLDQYEYDIKLLLGRFKYMDEVKLPTAKKFLLSFDVSPSTKKRMVTSWRSFWSYLNFELEIEEPRKPFDDIIPRARTKAAKERTSLKRQAFTVSEIEQLHRAAKGQDLKDLIKIGALTGMRIEEICSKSTIVGGWLVVSDAKSEAGNRRIPIHPDLQEGTLERWLTTRTNFKPNKYGIHSDAIGKRFGRLKKSLGFSGQWVFHSIRHTIATELKRSRPDLTLIINELLGHEKPEDMSMGLYAKQVDDFKEELIGSLQYNFLDKELSSNLTIVGDQK